MKLTRLKQLFADSGYTIKDFAELTGLSMRRLGQFLNPTAPEHADMSYWTLMSIAAALAPARQSTPEETFYYLLEDDLAELDETYAVERERRANQNKQP